MLSRKQFLKLVASSAALPALLSKQAGAQNGGTDYDVIVIGAGVAGLAAAERLVRFDSDIKVLVLEARDRIGGRIHSVSQDASARDAELGALYLDEPSGSTWSPLTRLGLSVETLPNNRLTLYPGMAELVRALAASSSGRLQLDSEVTDIFWREGLAGVNYANRGLSSAVSARRLIITLPVGVLRSGGPTIEPALPQAKLDAIQAVVSDATVTAALLFSRDTARLTDRSQPWVFEDATTRLRAFTAGPEGEVLLEAQFFGARAAALAGQTESVQLALATRAFGDALESLPSPGDALWSLATDWSSDPHSRGAGSSPGSASTHQELAENLWDTVFFAGEATVEPELVGTVHGAYESGERAARDVAESLGIVAGSDMQDVPLFELL